ncbi:MAG: hypothetical protein IIB59_06930 [Planctomycetes bacterium]|nr:hypothetical protein [Planctomycetota bacterium]
MATQRKTGIAVLLGVFAFAGGFALTLQTSLAQTPNEATRPPTADEVLRALQRARPVNPVIQPASPATRPKGPRPSLIAEGTPVVQRSGTLVEVGSWWTFQADQPRAALPLKLLPNATLEMMVRMVRNATTPIRFVVSGELTVFQNENYLMPRIATRSTTRLTSPSIEAEGKPTGQQNARTPESGQPIASDAAAEDVLAKLQAQEAEEVILAPSGFESQPLRGRGPTTPANLLLDGSALITRPGRIVRRESWWSVVFESDHPDNPEPPMLLLPNQGVELMVRLATAGGAGVVFLVSGEVTAFEGENYLLPRSVVRRIDTGNLRN